MYVHAQILYTGRHVSLMVTLATVLQSEVYINCIDTRENICCATCKGFGNKIMLQPTQPPIHHRLRLVSSVVHTIYYIRVVVSGEPRHQEVPEQQFLFSSQVRVFVGSKKKKMHA